jgi:hypothetical protein
MPEDVRDIEKFIKLSEGAEICRIKRTKDVVKLKLRTSKSLYTLKIEPSKLDETVKKLKCKTEDI